MPLSRITSMVATGLATLVFCTMSTAVASATEVFTLSTEKCDGSVLNLCWSNGSENFELTGKQSVTIAKKTSSANISLKSKLGGFTLIIECEGATNSATPDAITQSSPLVATGSFTGELVFESCKVDAPSGCSVSPLLESAALQGSLTSVSELKLQPQSGTKFIEFTITNVSNCPSNITGSPRLVTGSQVFTILNPGTPETTKSGEFVTKSGLALGEEAAELSGALTISFTSLEDKVVVVKTA